MPIAFILTAALAWFLYIMGSYYSFNVHFLGIGARAENDFLSFGYLFSYRSIHFVLFILLFIFVYYAAYYYLYKRKKETLPKKQASKLKPEIKVRTIAVILGVILFIFINLLTILVIRKPDAINPLDGVLGFAQKAFPTLLYLLLFFLTVFSSGWRILSLLKLKFKSYFIGSLIAVGTGLTLWYVILLILGTSGNYNAISIVISSIVLIISGYNFIFDLFKKIFTTKITIPLKPNLGIVLFVSILVVLLTNNFIDLTRPIGVGWDDLTRYINYPKLLAESGQTPSGNFGWPLLVFSGIGFAITNSVEIGNLLLFSNALFFQIFLVLGILGIGKTLKLKYAGLMAAVIFITTPMVTQQLIFDTKTDIALTAYLTLSLLTILLWKSNKKSLILVLSGIFAGMALGIKVTAIIGIITIIGFLFFKLFNWAGLLLSIAAAYTGLTFFGQDYFENSLEQQIQIVLLVLAVIMTVIALIIIIKNKYYKDLNKLKPKLIPILMWGLGLIISFSPIALKNLADNGFKIAPNAILVGVVNKPMVTEAEFYDGIERCEKKGFVEEVVRYIGFEQSINKYLKLPWNLTMNTQIGREYVDVGFITFASFSSLAGIFVLNKIVKRVKKEKDESKYEFNYMILPLIVISTLSFISWAFVGQSVPWYGMFLFVFILILVEMLFTSLTLDLFKKINYKVFLGSLISTGLFSFIIASLKYEDSSDLEIFILGGAVIASVIFLVLRKRSLKYFNSILLGAIIFGILIQLGFRAYNSSTRIVLAYATDTISDEEFIDITLYGYRYIDCVINGNVWEVDTFDCYEDYYDEDILDTPVYRIGTFVPYFIDQNNTRLFEDSRLDKIACLIDQKKPQDALEHLQDLGFEYLVYDTNSETIEVDPEGPVHKKVESFENWLKTLRLKEELVLCQIPENPAIEFYNLKALTEENPHLNNCRLVESDNLDVLEED